MLTPSPYEPRTRVGRLVVKIGMALFNIVEVVLSPVLVIFDMKSEKLHPLMWLVMILTSPGMTVVNLMNDDHPEDKYGFISFVSVTYWVVLILIAARLGHRS